MDGDAVPGQDAGSKRRRVGAAAQTRKAQQEEGEGDEGLGCEGVGLGCAYMQPAQPAKKAADADAANNEEDVERQRQLFSRDLDAAVSGRPCNVRREGGQSLVMGG